MIDRIQSELAEIERRDSVRILYACESGSRAWGFASADSDWDVRFIYVRPRDWYLSTDRKRDVIERTTPDDLDLSGWDLPKALGLLRKSNPPLLEWLRSPIVYGRDEEFMARFLALAEEAYSAKRCFKHYLSMATTNFRTTLQGEVVRLKKYLYVLRPIAACTWIERGLGPAPMEFEKLWQTVVDDESVRRAIEALVVRKMAGDELESEPQNPLLYDFVQQELARLNDVDFVEDELLESERFNELFRGELER